MEVLQVRAHEGDVGNEKVCELGKKGVKLRDELMRNEGGEGWFQRTVKRCREVRGR